MVRSLFFVSVLSLLGACGSSLSAVPVKGADGDRARLAGEWKPDTLESMATEIELAELPGRIDDILAGRITGRVVVKLGGEEGDGRMKDEG